MFFERVVDLPSVFKLDDLNNGDCFVFAEDLHASPQYTLWMKCERGEQYYDGGIVNLETGKMLSFYEIKQNKDALYQVNIRLIVEDVV